MDPYVCWVVCVNQNPYDIDTAGYCRSCTVNGPRNIKNTIDIQNFISCHLIIYISDLIWRKENSLSVIFVACVYIYTEGFYNYISACEYFFKKQK